MLPKCYQIVTKMSVNVTNVLPTCYQRVTKIPTYMLPNCYQIVTKMLPNVTKLRLSCYQRVNQMLPTRYQERADMLPECYQHPPWSSFLSFAPELPPGFPHPRVPRHEFAPWVPLLGPSLSSPPLGSSPLGSPPDGHPLDPHGTLPTHIHVPATSGAMARFGEPYVSNVRGLALLCMMGNVACRTDAISYNHGRADVVGVGTFCTRWCGGRGVLCDAGCCCVLGERFFLF